MTASDIHNEVAPQIVREIVGAATGDDGPVEAMMVILESVCLGVLLYVDTAYNRDPEDLGAALLEGIRLRLAEQRGAPTSQPKH